MKKINLVIPVYNGEKELEASVSRLYSYMSENIRHDWSILIANNASNDHTTMLAENLARQFPRVKSVYFTRKGRGNALKSSWEYFTADVNAYCDVDLATDISHLRDLFESVLRGANIATGNRYMNASLTRRSRFRLVLSRAYIRMIRAFFSTGITDFQCGFKAVDRKVVRELLPLVKDREWFFDTELLLLAESRDYSIRQIPIKWTEYNETKVKFSKTILDYTRNLMLLRNRLKWKNHPI